MRRLTTAWAVCYVRERYSRFVGYVNPIDSAVADYEVLPLRGRCAMYANAILGSSDMLIRLTAR